MNAMGDGEMAMRRLVASVHTLFVVFVMSSIASSGICSEGEYETGDEWIYNFDMQLETMTLSGTVTYSFDGESSKSVAGFAYSTYEIGFGGSLAIGGTMQGYTVSGTAAIAGTDSVDKASLNTIVSDYNISMTVTVATFIPVTLVMWEHNVTTYSPPSGTGEEPDDPDEGESWTKTYTVHYETMAYDDGAITVDSSSVSVTKTYTYLGVRTITVAAGTFECEVIQEDDGDSITTDWYCDDVGTHVKSVYESSSSGSGTEVLTSFSYTPPSTGGDLSNAMILIASGIAVVVVVVITVAWILMRRRSPPKEVQTSPVIQEPGPPRPPAA